MDLEVLRKAPLFTNLDDEVFAILTSELTEVELSRGASAFHEGDQGDQLYVIMSGKIKLGRTASDGLLVAHDLTQEELAQLVGASRETVNKALAEFVQRGWIRLENRAVVILDLQRLRQRSR